ncbi:MAG: membrane protein insertion efficiency factor YidD [Clostridium sp.]|nr:membrane protein insertion efficiency factor YidD [Clostridium sp.]MCM1444408.1 membrane protein insertion efficiency factor YidD [Candidatus Amulumruptor caecigallinarius]
MKYILIGFIGVYQMMPLKSHGMCKYIPSCSNYAIDAINKYGSIKGMILSIKRVLRCNPKSLGGYDPVPERKIK